MRTNLSDAEHRTNTGDLATDTDSTNVVTIVSGFMDYKTSIESLRLAEEYSAVVYPALCIHPWYVDIQKENELKKTIICNSG
ncbi:hypothetical protein E2P42_03235 [Candidatus Bathyarchaeota archaeon]|nr:hypothetical protein E2P42_03235 [Candidatus Bathyarchaeota archaeon]